MSFSIWGFDVTGGWSLQQYSPQKGHIVRLQTSLNSREMQEVKSVSWTIYQTRNVVTYEDTPIVLHKFQKKWPIFGSEGDEELLDAEGWVKVSCHVLFSSGAMEEVSREFLVVPEIKCQIELEQWPPITSDTHAIDIKGYILCSALEMGNPFDDNVAYACGGACIETCPRYEVVATPIEGLHITRYGKHKAISNVLLRGEFLPWINEDPNSSCVSLYRNNELGANAKYLPLVKRFCILPRQEELRIVIAPTHNGGKDKNIHLLIDGLSRHMLPSKKREFKGAQGAKRLCPLGGSEVVWTISRRDQNKSRDKQKIIRHDKVDLKHCFAQNSGGGGIYKIKATISICGCDERVSTKCFLYLDGDNDAEIFYRANSFEWITSDQ